MIRFECKKCGSLVVTEKDSKTATCTICGKTQRIPAVFTEDKQPIPQKNYDPQWDHYAQLLYKARKYRDIKILTETAEEFDRLGDYENSRQMAEFCRQRAAEEQIKQAQKTEKEKIADQRKEKGQRRYHIKMALINAAVVALAIVIGLLGDKYFVYGPRYERADHLFAQGEYELALSVLEGMKDNRKETKERIEKTEAQIIESKYLDAIDALNKGHYASARFQFAELDGYKDSDTMILECRYRNALQFMESGNYIRALEEFTIIEGYKDSEEQIPVCEAGVAEQEAAMIEERYNRAVEAMNSGNYASARHRFEELNGYKDSEALALECRYLNALKLMEDGNYTRALEELEAVGNYKDAADQADIARSKITESQ